jgi:glutathione S-transferase
MAELILHHYDMSPYAEKIRLALGLKGLPWRSVVAPMVMPKTDLVELTGGHRRVPVLQIGADVYCDTHLIARVLDEVKPAPPLAPPGA